MKKSIILIPFLLAGCIGQTNNGGDLSNGSGVYQCVSSDGRPTLKFHSSTLEVFTSFGGMDGSWARFTNIDTGLVHTLHGVEDRDYDCSQKISEPGAVG